MTQYQQEAERLKQLIAEAQGFGEDTIIDLLKTQQEMIQLLLGRLQRYESAHQSFVAAIQGAI